MSRPYILLFCEGDGNSPDIKIMSQIKDSVASDVDVQIIPTGGKGQIGRFVDGYGRSGLNTHSGHIIFRDRDFDFEIPEKCQLIQTNNSKCFASYRTSVENYLLTPDNVCRFMNLNEIDLKGHKVHDLFIGAAKKIQYYSILRYTLVHHRQMAFSTASLIQDNRDLPKDLGEDSCKDSATKLIESFTSGALDVNLTNFEAYYNKTKERLNEEFFVNQEYMVWFHGKNIETALNIVFKEHGISPLNSAKFYETALQEFNFSIFPDLVELKDKILAFREK
jgi:hypothetical protein